jgi:hypothetical protein
MEKLSTENINFNNTEYKKIETYKSDNKTVSHNKNYIEMSNTIPVSKNNSYKKEINILDQEISTLIYNLNQKNK